MTENDDGIEEEDGGDNAESWNGYFEPDDVVVHVGPAGSRGKRLVIISHDETSLRDEIFPNRLADRAKLIKQFEEKIDVDAGEFSFLDDVIIAKADEADELSERSASDQGDGTSPVPPDSRRISEHILEKTPEDILEAAREFLENRAMFDKLRNDFIALGIAGENTLATSTYLVCTSRKRAKPLAGAVKSPTASGKSHVVNEIVSLMPQEDVVEATDMTTQALFYMEQGTLEHKIVSVAERKHIDSSNSAEMANAGLALREMLSSGKLSKYVPVKTDDGFTTVKIEQNGPIAYITTGTGEIFEEDANRMLALATDESAQQTESIMQMQAAHAAGTAEHTPAEQERIRQVHRTAQRLLRPVDVRISYAERVVLTAHKIVARRAFPQLLAMIRAVAMLRQFQKDEVEDGVIDADVDDYTIAYRLMWPVLRRTFAPLDEHASELLRDIQQHSPPPLKFTRKKCTEFVSVGDTELRTRIKRLVDAGCVEVVEGSQGKQFVYRVLESQANVGPILTGLVTPEQLRNVLETV